MCGTKKTTAVTLFLPKLATCHPALLSRLIRHAINHVKTNLRGITHDHIADIRHLAVQAPPGKHLDLPDRIRVYKTRDRIRFKRNSALAAAGTDAETRQRQPFKRVTNVKPESFSCIFANYVYIY